MNDKAPVLTDGGGFLRRKIKMGKSPYTKSKCNFKYTEGWKWF